MAGRNEETMVTNLPKIDIQRSTFGSKSHRHLMTANAANLNIIYAEEYLPGDTLKMNLATLIREQTPIHPTMDNLIADIYFFSIPRRLTWEHFKNFMGENDTSYWEEENEYEIPQVTSPESVGWSKGTLADQLGIRQGIAGISIDAQYLKSYCLVYNEWFRDENLVEPLNCPKDETTIAGSNGTDQTVDCVKGGMPAKVSKLHDVFTSALPEPQKGPDTIIPLGTEAPIEYVEGANRPFTFGTTANPDQATGNLFLSSGTSAGGTANVSAQTYEAAQSGWNVYPNKEAIFADLSNAQAATVNQLRQAFAVQRMYEKDARGGTRYTELVRSHFNVMSPDARQQRPEYLGGKRINLSMMEVVQTSSTDEVSPQGNTAGMSKTLDSDFMFEASFTEHGIILGLMCIRNENSYAQGVERKFLRKSKLDFYWPALAHIGEVGIKNIELYAQGTSEDNEIFGYQEKDYEYRYSKNLITGEFSPDYATSLDSWHYGDDYSELPTLSQDWILADKSNVDRTIAIQSQDQFLCDFYFNEEWHRPMPMHGVPGLIDHY